MSLHISNTLLSQNIDGGEDFFMIELPSIQQLENLIIYSKARDLAAAAKEANITQSAFGFQMKKLEEIVGVQLVSHNDKSSDLTAEGRLFLPRAEKIVSELSSAVKDMRSLTGGQEVNLTVGALMSLGDVLMNQHITYFKKYNANIKISIYNLESKELLRRLKNNTLDIVSTFSLDKYNDLDECENNFFCNERMVYYAPNIEGRGGGVINIEEICAHPLVQYSPYYLMNETINKYFASQRYTPETEAWFSTPYSIIHYCQQNQVGALLSERLLNAFGFYDGYYDVEPAFKVKCHLLYKKTNPKYKFIKIFVNYVNTLYNKNECNCE